jgi:glycosyltransferase involved in cell wall biosynthesis
MSSGEFRILIQQPVVPHYRLPLFDHLHARYGSRIRVLASRRTFDGPDSVRDERPYLDLDHSCTAHVAKRFFWQHGLGLGRCTKGDVVVVSGNLRFLSSLWLFVQAHWRGLGTIWWGHGWSPTSSRWVLPLRRWIMRRADVVLLYTDAEVAQLPTRPGDTARVMGAQNAVDQSAARNALSHWAGKTSQFLQDQGLQDRRVLLFCGRLRSRPSTGLNLLLAAMPEIIVQNPEVVLVIIGDGEERAQLGEQARTLGIEAHVRFLGSLYDEEQLAPWFICATCFVYPGPIGLSLLHAMGYALPVVTHDNRARHNPEIAALRHEHNGLEFRDGDQRSLEQQVCRLLRSEALRATLARNARSTAHEDFTIGNMASRVGDAIGLAHLASARRAPC